MVQTLFADGLIRYSVSPAGTGVVNGLELLATREEIVPDTEVAMSWMASDFGMQMTLSRKVPEHIRANLGPFLERLAAASGLTLAQLCATALFAIHPGGPRINLHPVVLAATAFLWFSTACGPLLAIPIEATKRQTERDLTRFDLDFDLLEFPAPIYLTTRSDLGDVSQGQLVTLSNFYELF